MVHPHFLLYTIKYLISTLLTDLCLATYNAQNSLDILSIFPDGFSSVVNDLLAYRCGILHVQKAQIYQLLNIVLLIDLIKHLPSYIVINLLKHLLVLFILNTIGLVLCVVVFLIHGGVHFFTLILVLLSQERAFLAHLGLRDILEIVLRGLHWLEGRHHGWVCWDCWLSPESNWHIRGLDWLLWLSILNNSDLGWRLFRLPHFFNRHLILFLREVIFFFDSGVLRTAVSEIFVWNRVELMANWLDIF